MSAPDRPRYVLTFEALPGDLAPEIRLRRLLKYALRAAGFRCVEARELPPREAESEAKESPS